MSKWNRVDNLRKMMEKAKPLATNSIRLGVNKIKNHHNKTIVALLKLTYKLPSFFKKKKRKKKEAL